MPSPKILVSACLLGQPVRYDGGAAPCLHPVLDRWIAEGRVVPCCPEVAGGLPVPRPAAELQPDGRILDARGQDVTEAFLEGARAMVALARREGAQVAVLKEGSPSCGRWSVHDGTFTGRRIPGTGVAAAALEAAGVRVFSEGQLDEAGAWAEKGPAGERTWNNKVL